MQSYSGNSVIIERERALSELRWYHEIFVLTSIEVGIFFIFTERKDDSYDSKTKRDSRFIT